MDIKLILENQLAMMRWMLLTGMSAPDVSPSLREQIKQTDARIASWEDEPDGVG